MQSVAFVLNGASSSGKSSIVKAIQRLSEVPVLHASLDTFTDMFDWTAIGDDSVRAECHRVGVANFHATLPILASSRFGVVVDHVFEQHAWFEACRDSLKTKRTHFIGVRCPLPVLEQREKARGNRRVGLARWQFERVHQEKPYALEVDTSELSPDECAARILSFVSNAPKGLTRRQSQRPWLSRLVLRAARAAPAMVVAHLERSAKKAATLQIPLT